MGRHLVTLPAGPEYDLIGGGITILDSRTRDAAGKRGGGFYQRTHHFSPVTAGARRGRGAVLSSHAALTMRRARGRAWPAPRANSDLLELTGLVDANGVLAAGTRVETAHGVPWWPTAARTSAITACGRHGEFGRPAVRIVSTRRDVCRRWSIWETELGEALNSSRPSATGADRRAWPGAKSATATPRSAADGGLVVTALDDAVEHGGFTLAVEDAALAACIDEKINWLTDDRRIGYAEWVEEPQVFMRRAQLWNEGAR